jgi:hypothetical protein
MSSYTSISPDKLSRLIGSANAPTLIDVRIDEHFAADPRLIPGASATLPSRRPGLGVKPRRRPVRRADLPEGAKSLRKAGASGRRSTKPQVRKPERNTQGR